MDSSFKPNNWGYAMINAIDVINLTPTKRDSYKKAPCAKATGQQIDLHKTLLLPFWESCVATQDRQLHANEIGTKLTGCSWSERQICDIQRRRKKGRSFL